MSSSGQISEKNYNLDFRFEDLYSTHSDHFRGVSVELKKKISTTLFVGGGVEYSDAGSHDDNGWNLYHLHFFPLFISQSFFPLQGKRVSAGLNFREGLSLINYLREYQNNPGVLSYIQEAGIYGYTGLEIAYLLNKRLHVLGETGLKSFHISMNNLDVNPHGFTGKLGVGYAF